MSWCFPRLVTPRPPTAPSAGGQLPVTARLRPTPTGTTPTRPSPPAATPSRRPQRQRVRSFGLDENASFHGYDATAIGTSSVAVDTAMLWLPIRPGMADADALESVLVHPWSPSTDGDNAVGPCTSPVGLLLCLTAV